MEDCLVSDGGGGLKGGASCSHRSKKAFFKTKELRKKLKSNKRKCEDCERLIDKGQVAESADSDEILACVSCARLACAEHAKKHCDAPRSGDPHPFLLSINKGTLRCHPCDVDLDPLENPQDLVKSFLDEYKSFTKTKATEAEVKKEAKEEKAKVEVEQEKPSVSNDAATKPLAKADLEDEGRRPNRRNGSLRPSASTPNGFTNGETMIPAKGLSNLGNTCFFNSVMQCIMHTHHLQYYFERFGRVEQLQFKEDKTITLNDEKIELKAAIMAVDTQELSPLNDVVRNFIAEFRCGTSPHPGSVFTQITRKAPRFKGWQQQDAHELLRYLMDMMQSEEKERYKAAIAQHYGLPKTINAKKVDPVTVKTAKGYLNEAGRPLLDAVFGGTLLQTIRCSECGHISERMEQFLDLSVPLSANPMSARLAGGHNSNAKPSAHQKKKLEKLAKKANRRATKQTATKKDENKASSSNGDSAEEAKEAVEDLQISSGSEDVEEEEETEESRFGAGYDRIDMTKVLVPMPAEYEAGRSVGAALREFTAEELLAGANTYECEGCCVPRNKKVEAKGPQKKRVEAVKRYLIYEPPAVLTLQLKRFQQVAGVTGRLVTRKLGGHVEFPLLFDIAPFCCKNVERTAVGQKKVVYSLYGVVVHSGDLSGGHYIAYVKSRHRVEQATHFLEAARASCVDAMCAKAAVDWASVGGEQPNFDGQWYYCSDSSIQAVSETKVLNSEAYILFYERIA